MVQHPRLRKALQREKALFITTYDANGKPGTVEVWYVFHKEKVYIYTGRDSHKARKIAVDPRVKLALGTRGGPALHGWAVVCQGQATSRRIAEFLQQKYDHYWGSVEALAQEMLPGGSGVLLEIGELTAVEE